MVKVRIETFIVNNNTTVRPYGCSCIAFENIGDQSVFIMHMIPLAKGVVRSFNHDPGQILETTFPIAFSGDGEKQVLVTKTFFQ